MLTAIEKILCMKCPKTFESLRVKYHARNTQKRSTTYFLCMPFQTTCKYGNIVKCTT